MKADPLLSDDLQTLLGSFPNDALRGLVGIIKQRGSWSPFPAARAYAAHDLPDESDFSKHAEAIAREILWWGSNDLHRLFGEERGWCTIVRRTAGKIGVAKEHCGDCVPTWRLEGAIVQKALQDWEGLSQEGREEALRKAGLDPGAARGGATVTIGVLTRLGGQQLLSFLAARGASFAFAATVFAPVAAALGGIWAAYDLAGPSYRVIQPVVLTIAFTRQRLRDERVAAAFRD